MKLFVSKSTHESTSELASTSLVSATFNRLALAPSAWIERFLLCSNLLAPNSSDNQRLNKWDGVGNVAPEFLISNRSSQKGHLDTEVGPAQRYFPDVRSYQKKGCAVCYTLRTFGALGNCGAWAVRLKSRPSFPLCVWLTHFLCLKWLYVDQLDFVLFEL